MKGAAMGWWSTGRPGQIMGDDVADEIAAGFKFLLDMTAKKPNFQELLDSTAQMIRSDGGEFLSDADAVRGKPLEAIFQPPAPTLVSRPNPPIDDLLFNLGGVFRRVARHYLSTEYQRKPRLSELLDGLAFVLRPTPEEFLRDTEGLKLVEFRVKGE
jgi:hypothetical protein